MTINELINYDIDSIRNLDPKLKPYLQNFINNLTAKMNLHDNQNDINKVVDTIISKFDSQGLNMTIQNESTDEYLNENPYVAGYYNPTNDNVVIKENNDDLEWVNRVVTHELTHYVVGARDNDLEYTWIDEAMTESTAAFLQDGESIAYEDYTSSIDYYLETQ